MLHLVLLLFFFVTASGKPDTIWKITFYHQTFEMKIHNDKLTYRLPCEMFTQFESSENEICVKKIVMLCRFYASNVNLFSWYQNMWCWSHQLNSSSSAFTLVPIFSLPFIHLTDKRRERHTKDQMNIDKKNPKRTKKMKENFSFQIATILFAVIITVDLLELNTNKQ